MNGPIEHADRRMRDALVDAQCRDWTADRPDRVGFARLATAHWRIRAALGYNPTVFDDWWRAPVVLLVAAAGPTVLLLLAAHPADPLVLAGALAAGVLTTYPVEDLIRWLRGRRALRTPLGPAAIDDPDLYADLTRELEAAAAQARKADRPAAKPYEDALFWVDAAREELARRTYDY